MGESDGFQGWRVACWHSWPRGGIVAGLNFEFYNPASKQAVFQIRLEVSVRFKQNTNESCMLSAFNLKVRTRVEREVTKFGSAYYFTMNTQTYTMYTSIPCLITLTRARDVTVYDLMWIRSLIVLSYLTAKVVRFCARRTCRAKVTSTCQSRTTNNARQANVLGWCAFPHAKDP